MGKPPTKVCRGFVTVYIGTNAKVLGPVSVSDHVVIRSNAVVVSDIHSLVVVVGVAAKIIRTCITRDSFLHHKKKCQENC